MSETSPPPRPSPVVGVTFAEPCPSEDEEVSTYSMAGPSNPFHQLRRSLGQFSSSSSLLPHSNSNLATEPTGTWFQGCYYLVATVGAPFLLALPASFAKLGWIGGTITVLVAYLATLWCSTRMAHLHEHDGVRHTRYRDLGVAVFGPRLGRALVTLLQLIINTGMCTIYPVVCGQALQSAYRTACIAAHDGASDHCSNLLSPWIAAFAGLQLLMAPLPDIASLTLVQAMGALTSLGFCFLATLGALLRGRVPGAKYDFPGSAAQRVLSGFSALGSITLLFGNTVLIETQATLAAKPSSVRSMRRAAVVGYTIICIMVLAVVLSGYYAFGSGVASLVLNSIEHPAWLVITANIFMVVNGVAGYLMFAHSVFDWVDTRIALAHWTGLEYRDSGIVILKRLSFRAAFVSLTGCLAVALPFIQDLMGLVGAIGYSPLCFILPCVMWVLSRGRANLRWWELPLCVAIGAIFILVGTAAAAGATWGIVNNARNYHFFS